MWLFQNDSCQVSQPTLRREGDAGLTSVSSKKGKRAESPPTFIRGKCQKNQKRRGLRALSVKGSRVVFTHGEGISTPHVRPKGRQPLIECANMTLIFYVPFLCLYILYTFFIFFPFCGRQGCFPLLIHIPQFAMWKSDLRSSFLSSDFFYLKGDHFKALDLENNPFYLVKNRND